MSIDRGILDQQLQGLGDAARWWDQRELRDLPSILNPDERILALARGRVARPRLVRRSWLIVVTDRRLLCIRSARNSGWRQIEVSTAQILRTAIRVGPFRGRVRIVANGRRYRIVLSRADAYRLYEAILRPGAPHRDAVPGFSPARVARNIVDHMLALPAVALDPHPTQAALPAPAKPPAKSPAELAARDERVHMLEEEINELREQLHFFEQLVRERGAAPDRSASPERGETPAHERASSGEPEPAASSR
jgi:hypothetical protein